MASPKTLEIVTATVPVLEEYGTAITTVFYKNMFEDWMKKCEGDKNH